MTTTLGIANIRIERPRGGGFEPLARNAFRTLGLAASASQREVFEAAERLRLALKVGVEKSFDSDLAWLGTVRRDEGDVRDALGRLSDPSQRIFERLFWFSGRVPRQTISNVRALEQAVEELLADSGAAARHDAALLMLAGLFRLDPAFREAGAWARAYGLWAEVCRGEEFWSQLVAADLRGEFEQLASYGEAGELRRRAPRLVSAQVAGRARDAVARDDLRACGRALAVLRAAHLPDALVAEYESDILGPAEDRLTELCDGAFAWAKLVAASDQASHERRNRYNHSLKKFGEDVKPRLLHFVNAAGATSPPARRALEHAALSLKELAGFYRRADAREHCLAVLEQAWELAPPGSAAVEQIRDQFAHYDRQLAERAKNADAYPAAVARALGETRELELFRTNGEGDGEQATTQLSKVEQDSGCLGQIVLYALAILSCFALDKCGVMDMKSSRRFTPSAYNYNAFPQFTPSPMPSLNFPPPLTPNVNIERVTADELRRKLKQGQVVVVDVRTGAEYEAGHIPTARFMPEVAFESLHDKLLAGGRQVVVYCDCPAEEASLRVARRLWLRDVKNVAVLVGGFDAWVGRGFPTEKIAPSSPRELIMQGSRDVSPSPTETPVVVRPPPR